MDDRVVARRLVHAACSALLLCALLGSAAGTAEDATRTAGSTDWPTFGGDVGRSSASSAPTGITTDNVATMRLQRVRIDGTVDASAIYLHAVRVRGARHDVFFVTTTYGKTLAIDADSGTVLWRFIPPDYDRFAGSSRITTATPVADPSRQFIYAAAPDGIIRKLSVADGQVAWSTSVTRLPTREKIASPLSFFRGRVVTETGGYVGDQPPYQGHVALLDAGDGRVLSVWNSLCSDRHLIIDPGSCPESDSAIWGRAGAVIDTTTGSIFIATGNGRWDGRINWGDATIELDSLATHVAGNFTPANTESLDAQDADVGSTSPVLLGDGLVAQGGKDGKFRLLDWRRMRGTAPHRGGELRVVPTPTGRALFTAPAVLHTMSATWVIAADNGGTTAWTVGEGRLVQRWHNENAGTSPLIAGGLAFVYDPRGGLRVYDAEDGRLAATLGCDDGHWNSPVVADGRIALPVGNANSHDTKGELDIWRLLAAPETPTVTRTAAPRSDPASTRAAPVTPIITPPAELETRHRPRP